jgi:hypothetical protein
MKWSGSGKHLKRRRREKTTLSLRSVNAGDSQVKKTNPYEQHESNFAPLNADFRTPS